MLHSLDQVWLETTPDPSPRAYGFYQHHSWIPTAKIEGEDEIFTLRTQLK